MDKGKLEGYLMPEDNEKEIIEGWARTAAEYEPRPLNERERHQVERAELMERQAARTSFTLGELIWP